ERWQTQLAISTQRVAATDSWRVSGRITRATGLVLEATGLQLAVGAACKIQITPGQDHWAEAEVVGFHDNILYLMPQSDTAGLPPGARVVPAELDEQHRIPLPLESQDTNLSPPVLSRHLPVGEELLGRVLDGAGRPLDNLGSLGDIGSASLNALVINPLT